MVHDIKNPDKIDILSKSDERLIGNVKIKVLNPTNAIRKELVLKNYASEYSDYNKESLVIFLNIMINKFYLLATLHLRL